jgi:hypothetical protein
MPCEKNTRRLLPYWPFLCVLQLLLHTTLTTSSQKRMRGGKKDSFSSPRLTPSQFWDTQLESTNHHSWLSMKSRSARSLESYGTQLCCFILYLNLCFHANLDKGLCVLGGMFGVLDGGLGPPQFTTLGDSGGCPTWFLPEWILIQIPNMSEFIHCLISGGTSNKELVERRSP